MNVNYVLENLVAKDTKIVDGITFNQKRFHEDGYIVKDISFEVENQSYNFQERVKAFTLDDFEKLFNEAGCYLLDVFGDYKLHKYDPKVSERLIMIFK